MESTLLIYSHERMPPDHFFGLGSGDCFPGSRATTLFRPIHAFVRMPLEKVHLKS
jgi:hypothetical protein